MNSRERVLATLNHKQPDRPPRDLGSTTATGIHPIAYSALKAKLGLNEEFEYLSARALLAKVEDSIIDIFGIDLLPIITESSSIPPILDENLSYVDDWGVERRLPVDGGHYLVSGPPLANLNSYSELDSFSWPAPRTDFSDLNKQAQHLRKTTDKALVLNLDVGFLHQSQFMRGFDKWLMDLAADPEFAKYYMDRILDIWLADAKGMIDAVGDLADVVIYADDIAFQNSTMVSMSMYKNFFKPRQKQVFDLMIDSGMKVMYHSCGSILSILGDLVDLGVEVINPVQVSAKGMGETAKLKKEWGKHLTFWGGIDTHKVLPRGTTEDVRQEVWKRLNDLTEDGGYVLASVHDIQPEVPADNIIAMFQAADEWSEKNGGGLG